MLAEPTVVLWDYDGTLVDTEPIWQATEAAILAEHGVRFTEPQWEDMTGQHVSLSAALIAQAIGTDDAEGVLDELERRVVEHLMSRDLPYQPGAHQLLSEMAGQGVRCAVVTASSGRVMEAARDRLPASVEFLLTADDVTHPKPHPEGYEVAMARFGVSPSQVVILEDSVPGTQAALSSGAVVYAVPSVPLQPHRRMHIGEGLDGITWGHVVDVWRTRRDA